MLKTPVSMCNKLLCAANRSKKSGVALATLVCLLLVACGGGGSSSDGADSAGPITLAAALPEGDHILFAATALTLSESDRIGSLTVIRTGTGHGESVVNFQFNDNSALAGSDYTATAGELRWADGQIGEQVITFRVRSDLDTEAAENFTAELNSVQGIDTLGVNDSVMINIEDSPCNGSLGLSITADTVWSDACYYLQSSVTVSSTAELRIDAGTTVFADAGVQLAITDQARLDLGGNSQLPVIVQGANPVAGYWQGIKVSSSAQQKATYAQISDATIGLDMSDSSAFAQFEFNQIGNTSIAALRILLQSAQQLGDGNTYPNSPGGIILTTQTVQADSPVTLPVQAVHYVVSQSIIADGPLNIEAGVELRFTADAQIYVSNQGSLTALGSMQSPILFIGDQATPGYWNGIQWASSASSLNRLEYVTVAHGGGDPARPGNIIIGGNGTQLTLQSCQLSYSEGFGLVQINDSAILSLADVVYEGNLSGDISP